MMVRLDWVGFSEYADQQLCLKSPGLRSLLLFLSKDASRSLELGLSMDLLESFCLWFSDSCLANSMDLFLLISRSLEEGRWYFTSLGLMQGCFMLGRLGFLCSFSSLFLSISALTLASIQRQRLLISSMFSRPSADLSLELALSRLLQRTSPRLFLESLIYLLDTRLFSRLGRTTSLLSLLLGLGISLGTYFCSSRVWSLLLRLFSMDWLESILFLTQSTELFLPILGMTFTSSCRSECIYFLGYWDGRLRKPYFSSSFLFQPTLGDWITWGISLRMLLAELALRNLPSGSGLLGWSYLDPGSAYFRLFRFLGTRMVFSRLHLLVWLLFCSITSFADMLRWTAGFCSSYTAEIRWVGSTLRHCEMMPLRSQEQNLGSGQQMPFCILVYSSFKLLALNGGLRVAISQTTQPRDQISHLASQGRSFHTSGLVQQGVPVWVRAMPRLATLETLRSPSLQQRSEVQKTLAHLRSLWRMLISWRTLRPLVIWMRACQISDQLKKVPSRMCSFTFFWMSPASASYITMQRVWVLSSKKASRQLTMLGWEMEASMRTSLSAFSRSLSLICPILTQVGGVYLPSSILRTLQTQLNEPSPSLLSTANSSSRLSFYIQIITIIVLTEGTNLTIPFTTHPHSYNPGDNAHLFSSSHNQQKLPYPMQTEDEPSHPAPTLSLIIATAACLKKWTKQSRKSKDRYYRLRELVETEAKYLKDLQLISEKIQQPLKLSNFISEYEEREMFPNVLGMIHLSRQIHADMEALLMGWDRRLTLVGPTMIRYSKFMLVYSDFFKNYQATEKKLKLLRENHPEVQLIEKALAEPPRIETFENLISKPFQRPLKYHLILKEYFKETPKDHPDYKHLEEAIECYHRVNQRNNEAMEHKEKDKMLMSLDGIFKDIINTEARYFIMDTHAFVFNQRVKCFILSDLILISKQQGNSEIEYARIYINQDSFAVAPKNGIFLKNGLLVCGKKTCIYFTFQQPSERDKFLQIVNRIIIDCYRNKHYKQEIRGSRRSTVSSLSFRQTAVQELRESMTHIENALPRPPRIAVLGAIKRNYSSKSMKIYYLTKFQQPHPLDYHQLLYIDQEDINMIERVAKTIYPKQRDFLDLPCFEELARLMKDGSEVRNLEYKCIYYTLLLNSIFRHPQISKRTDIFMHKMDVCEGIWALIKYEGFQCPCQNCSEGQIVSTIEKYNQEIRSRQEARQLPLTFYCPFRTFRLQETISTMTNEEIRAIQSPFDRIFWIKCKRGDIEYRLLDSTLVDQGQSKLVIFHLCCGIEDKKYQKHVRRHDRVGQIKCTLGKQLNIDLSQYQMCMQINKGVYLLGDDQVLFKLLNNQVPVEQGFASLFRSAFGTKEDTTIKVYLKRVWWLFTQQMDITFTQRIETRTNLFVEELAFRIRNQEIQLTVTDTITFYACYFIYSEAVKKPEDITPNLLQSLVPSKKWKVLSQSNRDQQLNLTRMKFKTLSEKTFAQLERAALKEKLFSYLVKYLKSKPIWGIYIFEAQYISEGKGTPVRIGFDFNTFMVKEAERLTTIFEYKISEVREKLLVSSWQLRIVEQEREQVFVGSCFVQMVELLDMFIQYQKTFLKAPGT